jgi:hypothetical protein
MRPKEKSGPFYGCRIRNTLWRRFFAAATILFAAWALNVGVFFGLSPEKRLSLPLDLN